MKNNYTAKMASIFALIAVLSMSSIAYSRNEAKNNKTYESNYEESNSEENNNTLTYNYQSEENTINYNQNEENNTPDKEIRSLYYAYVNTNSSVYENNNQDNIVDYIESYQKVLAYDFGEYSYITYTTDDNISKYGYVFKNNLTKLPEKYIEIDLGSQIFRVINNNETTLETKCTTGKDSTQTNIGYFDIDGKYLNACLRGPGYECPVSYWVPFDGGIGFHDYVYQSDDMFGSQSYHTNGSHGCVRLMLEDAKNAYNEIETGDMVLVHK